MKFFMLTVLLLVIAIDATLACECGREGSSSRIYKGKEVKSHKYPWMIYSISYDDRKNKTSDYDECGGVLIDETHYITIATCLTNKETAKTRKPEDTYIIIGRINAYKETTKPIAVSKIWIDPRYNTSDLTYDLAVVTLATPVKYSQIMGPICLPDFESGLSKLTVAGWGYNSSEDNADRSENLFEVEVDYMNKEECNKAQTDYVMTELGIPESKRNRLRVTDVKEDVLCAINKKTRGTFCDGDNGGPLMHHGSDGRWYLMGIAQGAWASCGEANDRTSLYTRIFPNKDIIKSLAPNSCWRK
uniref:Serine protease 48-like isoform X1 n=1 Tax=Tetranychus evansi TaxID=178897 RepID=A0A3G5AQW3_9ACAR|nr:serine protease 48-like isoform X1 [Tetranychus evansi]